MLFNLLQKVYQTKIKLFLCLLCLSFNALRASTLYPTDQSVGVMEALATLGYDHIEKLDYTAMIARLQDRKHYFLQKEETATAVNYILSLHQQGHLKPVIEELQQPVFSRGYVEGNSITPVITREENRESTLRRFYQQYQKLPPRLRRIINVIVFLEVGVHYIRYRLHKKRLEIRRIFKKVEGGEPLTKAERDFIRQHIRLIDATDLDFLEEKLPKNKNDTPD